MDNTNRVKLRKELQDRVDELLNDAGTLATPKDLSVEGEQTEMFADYTFVHGLRSMLTAMLEGILCTERLRAARIVKYYKSLFDSDPKAALKAIDDDFTNTIQYTLSHCSGDADLMSYTEDSEPPGEPPKKENLH